MSIVNYLCSRPSGTEGGSALLKYGLVIALAAVIGVLALTTWGSQVVDRIVAIGDKIATGS